MRRTGCSRASIGGSVEATLVDRHDVQVIPHQPDGVLQVEPQHRLVGQPVDGRQRLGQRQCRRAPRRVAVEGVEHDGALAARRSPRPAARWCRGRPSPSAPQLDEDAVDADAGPHGDRLGRTPRSTASRWQHGAGGDQPIEVGRLVVERAELRRGPPGHRDDDALTRRRPAARRPRDRPAAPGSIVWTHVYTSRVATPGQVRRCMGAMNFAFTEEQDELRRTVRAFLDSKSPESAVREQMETEDGYDPAVWSQMAEQMGLQGLHVPEEYGGSGFSYVELGIVLEEMGRALLCAPVLLDRRAGGQHAHPQRRRRSQEGLPARASPAARRSPPSPSPSPRGSGTSRASRWKRRRMATAGRCRERRASCSTATRPN